MNILKNNRPFILVKALIITFLLNSCAAHKIEKDLGKQGEKNDYFRGMVVFNTKTGKEIINYNGNKYFTPASNTKLFTFYTAYKTFRDSVTGLQYTRKKDSLIIRGTADPTFLYGFEDSKTLNFLKKETSNIYLLDEQIDEDVFGPGWAWDDYTYDYMPEKSVFPIYGNIVTLNKTKDQITIVPELFKDDVVTDPSMTKRRDYIKNIFYVKPGEEIEDHKIPFITSNQLVADLLGEVIGKKIVVIPPKEDYKFWDLKSVKYDSVYKQMLYVSDNFIAEQLMLQVGYAVDSSYSVSNAINYSLENYLKGIPQKPRWVDGSGLSRYNLFTPEGLVFLLKKMYKEIPHDKLFDYFPVGGQSGTLKNYYKNERPYIHAKSGTLSNNYNLSGYLVTKKGTVLIFSFMNNHYQGSSVNRKKEMERVFLKLYNSY
jgi:D-alanyl-D-alanine carboxypeptidase/D-alanyl-D-alanine-endopeptidase (penicillin-binding protein 4)